MLILIKNHKTPEECQSPYVLGFVSFISITHPIPKEKTVITVGSSSHEDFIRILVFSFTGFNMNIKNA